MTFDEIVFIFVTAVIFTIVGHRQGIKKANPKLAVDTIAVTIDSLITDGYLLVEGTGDDAKILKPHQDFKVTMFDDDQTT